MERKQRAGKFIKRVRSDYVFRTFAISAFSFFVTAAFTAYNLFLGLAYKAAWNVSVAAYYAVLAGLRAYIVLSERQFVKKRLTAGQKEEERKNLFFVQSIMLFLLDFALIAPIILMALRKKEINYSVIPAIATAAYTVFKTVIAIRNFIKAGKYSNLSVKILKNISFIDAFVSVLSLQYILIVTFDDGTNSNMPVLGAVTSVAIWSFLVIVSVLSVVRAVRIRHGERESSQLEI